jgi:hypothetical protein
MRMLVGGRGVYFFSRATLGTLLVFRREHSASIKDFVRQFVGRLVGWLLCPHITLNVIFLAMCRPIDLKFSRDLHVDLLFQFLFFFFLSSSFNSSMSSFSSSFSTEIKLIYN